MIVSLLVDYSCTMLLCIHTLDTWSRPLSVSSGNHDASAICCELFKITRDPMDPRSLIAAMIIHVYVRMYFRTVIQFYFPSGRHAKKSSRAWTTDLDKAPAHRTKNTLPRADL
jgi:hypothetical protein